MTVSVLWLFLAVPWVDVQWLIVTFPGHTDLLFAAMRIVVYCVFSPWCHGLVDLGLWKVQVILTCLLFRVGKISKTSDQKSK